MPCTVAAATMAPDKRKPTVLGAPPFAVKASHAPEGTSARRSAAPVTRPSHRCARGDVRTSLLDSSATQAGSDHAAATTCTRKANMKTASSGIARFSVTNGLPRSTVLLAPLRRRLCCARKSRPKRPPLPRDHRGIGRSASSGHTREPVVGAEQRPKPATIRLRLLALTSTDPSASRVATSMPRA